MGYPVGIEVFFYIISYIYLKIKLRELGGLQIKSLFPQEIPGLSRSLGSEFTRPYTTVMGDLHKNKGLHFPSKFGHM